MAKSGNAPCGQSFIAKDEYVLATIIDNHMQKCKEFSCRQANSQLADDFDEDDE